jgi:hypothetical protein
VATGTVVACGLAVVLRIENEPGRRRILVGALCATMALVFALALAIPFLRDFYELTTPTSEAVVAWAIGSVIGIAGMLGVLRVLRVE